MSRLKPVWGVIAGVLLSLVTSVQAEPALEGEKNEGLVVVPKDVTDVRAIQLLNRSNPPLDANLDESLSITSYDQHELVMRLQQQLLKSKKIRACEEEHGTLSGYLDQATRAVAFLDHEGAQRELQSAFRAIQCTHERISSQEFARYLFLQGLRTSLEGFDPESYFMQALGVDSALPAPVRNSKAIQAAFERARKQLSTEAHIQVEIEADGSGILTRVDGDIPLRGMLHLQPGLHVIQRETQTGEVLISDVIRLQRPESGIVLWPPDQHRVESASIVTHSLETWSSHAALTAAEQEVLRALPERMEKDWIILLNPTSSVGKPLGMMVSKGELVALTLAPPPRSALRGRQTRRAILSGVITLVSTGLYLEGIYLSRGWGETSYMFQGAGGIGLGIGTFGVGFSLWQLFSPEWAGKKERAGPATEKP